MRDEQRHSTVFDHVAETILRKHRIEWHVGASSFHDTEEGNDHVDRAIDEKSHEHIRADASLFQVAGELVGSTLEFTVGYVSVFKKHRGRVG